MTREAEGGIRLRVETEVLSTLKFIVILGLRGAAITPLLVKHIL